MEGSGSDLLRSSVIQCNVNIIFESRDVSCGGHCCCFIVKYPRITGFKDIIHLSEF
jgi:hypothetical protein